ncbi:2-dehydropantoate 2-reductase [Bacillus alkalicellulosilyticus]|uniref:2-dehydropantoate 2-reductase n=1 Tax=Alkalihalobacterium alkalicellulosilyticum TaxID=1912214 RepID=UPI0009967321|nr:2-dehydropantoate 2-reductase [Bacillus alkalicellulosilyticus]
MRIGIIGGGAVGLLLAAYSYKAGYSVTILTRTIKQAEDINMKGITLFKEEEMVHYPIQAYLFSDSSSGNYDLIFIAVKQSILPFVVSEILKNNQSPPPLVFLQNGMSHLSLLEQTIIDDILVGVLDHGALRISGTEVIHTGKGTLRIGQVKGTKDFQMIWNTLSANGFTSEKIRDWLFVMKKKLVVNALINPLTAIYKVKNGELIEQDSLLTEMKELYTEVIDVLQFTESKGLWEYVLEVCQKTSQNKSSMLQDIENNKQTEIDAILGYLLEQGRGLPVKTSKIETLYQTIKKLERNEEKM